MDIDETNDVENLRYVLSLTSKELGEFLIDKPLDELKYVSSLLIRYEISRLKSTFADLEEIEKELDKLAKVS